VLIYAGLPGRFARLSLALRWVAALVAFPVVALALGRLHGWWYGYWG